jgi:hypothetical protein
MYPGVKKSIGCVAPIIPCDSDTNPYAKGDVVGDVHRITEDSQLLCGYCSFFG